MSVDERTLAIRHLTQAIKRETDGNIDVSINSKNNKHNYQTNMNELTGFLSRHISEYMNADTMAEILKKKAYKTNKIRFCKLILFMHWC